MRTSRLNLGSTEEPGRGNHSPSGDRTGVASHTTARTGLAQRPMAVCFGRLVHNVLPCGGKNKRDAVSRWSTDIENEEEEPET